MRTISDALFNGFIKLCDIEDDDMRAAAINHFALIFSDSVYANLPLTATT